MSLIKISSFQTADGKLFSDKVEALQHDFKLTLRGILNGGNVGKVDNFTTAQVAESLVKNLDAIQKAIKESQNAINRSLGYKKKLAKD